MRNRGKKHRKGIIVAVFLIAFAIFLAYHLLIMQSPPPLESGDSVDFSRAVVIDGIGLTKPNLVFLEGVREVLVKAGLNVESFCGSQVTIRLLDDFGGYGLVILRAHSAIDTKHGFLYIFSAESYSRDKYLNEQYYGAYREAYTFDSNEGPYFALRADLLGSEGGLKGSVIILMGCNGTNSDHAIEKLFERGVKAIIAWDGYVDLEYTDKVVLALLRLVYEEGLSFCEAVQRVMDMMGPDPIWGSRLVYLDNPEV